MKFIISILIGVISAALWDLLKKYKRHFVNVLCSRWVLYRHIFVLPDEEDSEETLNLVDDSEIEFELTNVVNYYEERAVNSNYHNECEST